MQHQTTLDSSQRFLTQPPPYTRLHPFGSGSKTTVNVPTWLVAMFSSPATLLVLAAIFYQDRTHRRGRPYTYVEIALRAGLTRGTVAWALWEICQVFILVKEIHKNESYWQTVGKKNNRYKKLCKRNRSASHMNWTLINERNKEEAHKRKAAERAKRKTEKAARKEEIKKIKELEQGSFLPTPLKRPPTIYDGDKSSEPNFIPNLGVLEALFEENKIRSYKMDGDMRCRRYISKTLKGIKMADLLLAVTLFAQNRFLMDANTNGWLVARANSLRAEGKEPFVNGKQINRYKNWCPSMVWFVANIHKILNGAYNRTTPEERARIREEAQKASEAPKQSSLTSVPSSEALATMEKKRLEKEGQDKMDLQAKRDREASHLARPYWNDLRLEDRYKLEEQFIEAIRKGETSLDPATNTKDKFFKILKEQMLLTWLGYQLAEKGTHHE
jgi:hypothetical protein